MKNRILIDDMANLTSKVIDLLYEFNQAHIGALAVPNVISSIIVSFVSKIRCCDDLEHKKDIIRYIYDLSLKSYEQLLLENQNCH